MDEATAVLRDEMAVGATVVTPAETIEVPRAEPTEDPMEEAAEFTAALEEAMDEATEVATGVATDVATAAPEGPMDEATAVLRDKTAVGAHVVAPAEAIEVPRAEPTEEPMEEAAEFTAALEDALDEATYEATVDATDVATVTPSELRVVATEPNVEAIDELTGVATVVVPAEPIDDPTDDPIEEAKELRWTLVAAREVVGVALAEAMELATDDATDEAIAAPGGPRDDARDD
jgi:hypothetical protein